MRTSYKVLRNWPRTLNSKWGKIILDAELRGYFEGRHIAEAREWPTCACGQQDDRIPREFKHSLPPEGKPKDDVLSTLGTHFYRAVKAHDFFNAAHLLLQIELRAEYILSNLEKDT